jgi:hypothetical protein
MKELVARFEILLTTETILNSGSESCWRERAQINFRNGKMLKEFRKTDEESKNNILSSKVLSS